jgi:hypothetical protein
MALLARGTQFRLARNQLRQAGSMSAKTGKVWLTVDGDKRNLRLFKIRRDPNPNSSISESLDLPAVHLIVLSSSRNNV